MFSNYRWISLIKVGAKILTTTLAPSPLKYCIKDPAEAGFMQGCQASDNIRLLINDALQIQL